MKIRQLTVEDLELYQKMQTGLDSDYMLRAFERLTTPPEHHLFGLFVGEELATIAGYSLFPGGYAMLGRLRSDMRFRGAGHATAINRYLIDLLETQSEVNWVGGYTNVNNLPARKILHKLDIPELQTYHNMTLVRPDLLNDAPGNVWASIDQIDEKRRVIDQLAEDVLTYYPLECYYPFPYSKELITDEKLAGTRFYHNEPADRWLLISDDVKGDNYAQVRYFWEDYFSQAGLFETVLADIEQSKEPRKAWFDFTPEAFEKIPNKAAFDIQEAWILYGKFLD